MKIPQVLSQPAQIPRSQHQNQVVATPVTASSSVTTTHTTQSGQLVHEAHIQHQETNMEQGNNMQSIGTVVVPMTNQDGSVALGNVVPSLLSTSQSGQIPVMYSVFASPSSGLVTVANLPEGATEQGSTQQLTADGTDVGHPSLPNSLTLATVQVQQDMAGNMQNYSQAVSTQTSDEMHTIVSDGTLTVGADAESELDKDGVPVTSSQTEVWKSGKANQELPLTACGVCQTAWGQDHEMCWKYSAWGNSPPRTMVILLMKTDLGNQLMHHMCT